MRIRYKLVIILMIILIVPIIILTSSFKVRGADAVCEQQIAALKTINDDKAAFLDEFLNNVVSQEKIFTSDEMIRSFVGHYISDEGVSDDELEYTNGLIEDIIHRSEGITEMFIMDYDGNIIASNDTSRIGTHVENYEELSSCIVTNGGISRFYPSSSVSKCYFYACRSIYSTANERAGMLVERISLEIPCEILKLTGYDNNVYVILIDSEGKFITSSISIPRKLEDVNDYRTVPGVIPEVIPFYTDSVSRDTASVKGDKFVYFGTAILNGNWSLVMIYDQIAAKSDVSFGSGALVIILIVIASAAIITVCYFFTEPIDKIIRVIARKNKGDANVRLELDSNDEFGQISYEFNAMFDSIFESEQLYRTVVSMMDNIVFEINLKTFKVYVSNNFDQKFSYRPKDDSIQESFLYKLKVHKDDLKRYRDDMDEIVAYQKEEWEGEYRFKSLYGDFTWIRIRGKKFFDRNNTPSKIIGILVDIDREKKSAINLIQKASYDALTQLYNRQTFMRTLDEEMVESYARRSLDALMFIDLDDFKHFNDEYGHKCGDEVLKFVADTIKEVTYEKGFGGRLGGDEFVMCLTNLKLIGDAGKIAAETISILNEGFISESTELHFNIHCSIGIAFFRENGSNSTELLEAADAAMYKIKKSGKSNYAYAGDYSLKEINIDSVENTFDSTF